MMIGPVQSYRLVLGDPINVITMNIDTVKVSKDRRGRRGELRQRGAGGSLHQGTGKWE